MGKRKIPEWEVLLGVTGKWKSNISYFEEYPHYNEIVIMVFNRVYLHHNMSIDLVKKI